METTHNAKKTTNVAICYGINIELKFLYKKKQLNKQIYNIQLEYATFWPTTWQLIQTTIDRKLHQQMETYYNHLNKKTRSSSSETTEASKIFTPQ
jgi:hypothetical protein